MSDPERARHARTRIEREEFARGHRAPGAPVVPPRPAATIVVARPTAAGFEVLLLERPSTTRFAAGAFVFPGGVVDEADADPAWKRRLPEVPDAERAALVAAIRELFEETGVLPAPSPRVAAEALVTARHDLLAGRRAFADIAGSLDLSFRDARLAYFARWVTPERLTRRYDTRFFFAALDGPRVEVTLTPEHASGSWSAPAAALDRFRGGELPMLFPTWKTLEGLAGYRRLDDALSALRATRVRTVTPRLDVSGETIRPLLPGDPGYDDPR